jgi:hypothetical protein
VKIRNEVNFALVPEWVLFADISAQAVRLYAFLNRHATKSGRARCRVSRRELAAEMRVQAPKTVDRALDELEGLGAIEVEVRVDAHGQQANDYLVRQTPKGSGEQVSIPLDTDVQGWVDTDVEGPLDTDVQPKDKSSRYKSSKDLNTSRTFVPFWAQYPPNAQGKKPDKQLALKQWLKLSPKDQERAMVAVENYAAACADGTYAKYAHRWLRDRTFEAWQTPARASPNGNLAGMNKHRGINDLWERDE